MMVARRLAPSTLALLLVACGGSSSRNSFDNSAPPDSTTTPPPSDSLSNQPAPPSPGPTNEIHEVLGHSAKTLYKLDPDTKAVTVIADFSGCSPVTDIALDGSSNLWASANDALYKVDKTTAACTLVAKGAYPNSLSFVPKGTVDPSAEALVGYQDSDYVRIDLTTGKMTKIGALGSGMRSSGDIVSVKGGATYLTVKSTSCADCLIEVDPKTGDLVKNWGPIGHKDVFGLSFWGGKVYGFDNGGELFEVTFSGSSIKTAPIAIPGAPSNLSFWGAGSTTSAPLVATPQ